MGLFLPPLEHTRRRPLVVGRRAAQPLGRQPGWASPDRGAAGRPAGTICMGAGRTFWMRVAAGCKTIGRPAAGATMQPARPDPRTGHR